MVRIKFCGIRETEYALAAARAGVDFIGLVFASSRRQITVEKAREIVTALRGGGFTTEVVGVFVNRPASEINKIARDVPLDRVQLSGDESWEYCRDIEKPVIKTVHISDAMTGSRLVELIDEGLKILSHRETVVILDTLQKGIYGGSGQTFNWKLVREAAQHYYVVLAGGLTPENVVQAIDTVHPWGVDASSGLETNGIKDIEKIEKFVQAVRGMECERNLHVSF